ncbi:hypothetical protein C2857_001519 [Epichloe festucae Fl1]|uniref:Uncharacterized protein n=1 Tax=Epichloe festucae (strain Fl1) TaxID=877507 RepID=A0A7S9KNA1_EPIFF|nr:hypothetical protein C2857_001519 [Epichloe festucae Fl1]
MDLALPQNASVETIPIQRLTVDVALPCAELVERFRHHVPPIKAGVLREQTSAEGIARVIQETGTKSGFVLFAEFDHGRWIRHFPPFSTESTPPPPPPPPPPPLGPTAVHERDSERGRGAALGAHRFIFGNPLFAIDMIRESVEATLHVPLDCGFVEQPDGSTRIVMLLVEGLIAGHSGTLANEGLRQTTRELQIKVFRLMADISRQVDTSGGAGADGLSVGRGREGNSNVATSRVMNSKHSYSHSAK